MKVAPRRLIRVVLVLGVSLWMAGGGCMFGCTGQANASVTIVEAAPTAQHSMANKSCHAQKKSNRKAAPLKNLVTSESLSLENTSDSRGECPLAANATTAGAKPSWSIVQRVSTVVAVLPQVEERSLPLQRYSARLHLPGRSPTYLRCCVFLV